MQSSHLVIDIPEVEQIEGRQIVMRSNLESYHTLNCLNMLISSRSVRYHIVFCSFLTSVNFDAFQERANGRLVS